MYGYEVLTKLADGSAAEVFLAKEESSQRRLILEVLRPELLNDAATYGRFIDEAKERQNLQHPNLVRRQRFGCGEDGRIYAVTEPLRGDHLGRRLKNAGSLPPVELCRILIPICDALEYLHKRGQVHGALRPSTIYVDPTGIQPPKLLDTGLSLLRTHSNQVTLSGLVLVEAEYLAPERIGGRRGDTLSDVYGLGVLMFELLTGTPPYSAADPSKTRLLHLSSRPPNLPAGCEALTPIVHRCLAKKRKDRFPDVLEVRRALEDVLEQLMGEPAPTNRTLDDSTLELSIEVHPVERETQPSEAPVTAWTPPPLPSLAVGGTLGSYELEKSLGEGGMGLVFLARHKRLGKRVALKVLRPEEASNPIQLQRFFQEARALNEIQNPHIVRIHDLVEEGSAPSGRVYLVMEALEGKTIKELAASEKVTVDRAVLLMAQVCDALSAAHEVGMVHRDIKPANLFVTKDRGGGDFVKVLDFGVAKLAGGPDSLQMTQTGVIVGTPSFMAPEQGCAETVDHRADLYAVGAVLYSLLTGRPPFYGDSVIQILGQLLTQKAPPLPSRSALGEPISEHLRSVVGRVLEKMPTHRFASAAELKSALLGAIKH